MKTRYCLFILLVFGFVSCNPTLDQQPEDKYLFSVKVNISPIKQVYVLGDTIWFEADFPTKIMDQISKSEVNLPTPASFTTIMSVGRINKSTFNNQQRYGILFAVDNFEFVAKKGNVTKPQGSMAKDYYRALSFVKDESGFTIKFGIKCKTRGIFALTFPDMGTYNWGDDNFQGVGPMNYETKVKGERYSLIKDLNVFNSDFISENCYVFKVE